MSTYRPWEVFEEDANMPEPETKGVPLPLQRMMQRYPQHKAMIILNGGGACCDHSANVIRVAGWSEGGQLLFRPLVSPLPNSPGFWTVHMAEVADCGIQLASKEQVEAVYELRLSRMTPAEINLETFAHVRKMLRLLVDQFTGLPSTTLVRNELKTKVMGYVTKIMEKDNRVTFSDEYKAEVLSAFDTDVKRNPPVTKRELN